MGKSLCHMLPVTARSITMCREQSEKGKSGKEEGKNISLSLSKSRRKAKGGNKILSIWQETCDRF